MHGKLIIIEGLDGCGKSTQVELLKETFPDCRFLTFPNYNSPSGEIITEYLQGRIPETDSRRSAYSSGVFYAMDRYISYRKDWYLDDKNHKPMISARYTTSNMIYQTAKLPRDEWEDYLEWLADFEYHRLGIPRPDAVIFLDLPIAVSQKLLSGRYENTTQKKDIHESDQDYFQKCYEAAQYLIHREHWHVLSCYDKNADSIREIEEIQEDLVRFIREILES
ncbi:MAG: deoxynucleoside kinase [Oscillospiraceae bacterium]|nr:deoxynucleoside kinase [Oscillospiraceae bacterium]